MKAVILAGGLGTRISEESDNKPKPMITIGGMPILWHIMKIYSTHQINEFVICCGYRGYVIKEYFANYFMHSSDNTVDLRENSCTYENSKAEPWKITMVETGEKSMTGGRLKRVEKYLSDETFCFTYGDGVANVDIGKTIDAHKRAGLKATLTAVQPAGRYGSLKLNENSQVSGFMEKPMGDGMWVNGGFFVLEPEVLDLIDTDSCVWEEGPLEKLSSEGQLNAHFHNGFWQPMDTLRDKRKLEELWEKGNAPWKTW